MAEDLRKSKELLPMKLLVLGASGGCGRWLAQLAAERGHQVTALVRPNTNFVAPAEVDVRRGQVLDPSDIEAAVTGQDIVLSCLGLRRAGPSPWARLLSPPDLMANVARILISVMRRQRIQRLMVVSAGGVGDSAAQLTRPVRWLIDSGQLGTAYRDLENMEQELMTSGLDWLAVRPVTLVNGQPTGAAHPAQRYGMFSIVRRSDVAGWMLSRVESPEPFEPRAVLLGSRG
jgi:uncharacterized protein YbjT (DUF2867 family)